MLLSRIVNFSPELDGCERDLTQQGLDTSLIQPMRDLSAQAVTRITERNYGALTALAAAMEPIITQARTYCAFIEREGPRPRNDPSHDLPQPE